MTEDYKFELLPENIPELEGIGALVAMLDLEDEE